ncbi:peptidylprolyl isomerase [Candidatus Riflebacteria bacterium]
MFKYFLILFLGICSLNLIFCTPGMAQKKATKKTFATFETSYGNFKIELFPDKAPKTVANFVELAQGKKEFTDQKTNEKVKRKFYDGLIFHRVINDFMLQGGCPLGRGTGGPGYRFKDEISAKSLGLSKMLIKDNMRAYGRDLQNAARKSGVRNQVDYNKFLQKAMKWSVEELYKALGYGFDNSLESLPVDYGHLAMANSGPNSNGSQFFVVTKKGGCSWLNGKHTVFGRVVQGMDIVHKIEKCPKNGSVPEPKIYIKSVKISNE